MKWHFLAISAFNWQGGTPFRGRSGICPLKIPKLTGGFDRSARRFA